MIYPKVYLESITEITTDFLEKNKLKGLILDLDNTLIDIDRNMPENIKLWCLDLKEKNIKIMIVSNTKKYDKIKKIATILGLEFIYFAKKPFKKGFLDAQNKLELNNNEIGVVGDQILTDIVGANRCKMFPILVKPIDKRDIFITRAKRPIENLIVKRFLKRNKK